MRIYKFLVLVLSGPFILCHNSYAQSVPQRSLRSILAAVNAYADSASKESIYIHTDKPNYTKGDTVWFKTYVFDKAFLTSTRNSGIAYVELTDLKNESLKRVMVPVSNGIGWGYFVLDKEISPGNYMLRSYTNWMRNYNEVEMYARPLFVSAAANTNWMFSTQTRLADKDGKQNAAVRLLVKDMNGNLQGFKELGVKIMLGRKNLFSDKMQTGSDGVVDFNFNVPELTDARQISIVLTHTDTRKQVNNYVIPVTINDASIADLQLMPEGGELIAGLRSRVGFKVVGEDGRGINVKGAVYHTLGEKLLDIETTHAGMGVFEFTPVPGEKYIAKVLLPNGAEKVCPLPEARPWGTTMRVENGFGQDSVTVLLSGTTTVKTARTPYFLVAHARGVACGGATINFNSGKPLKFSKGIFPSGLVTFTLLDADMVPVNNRLVFIDHNDQFKVVTETRAEYRTRDSVGLNLLVNDTFGKPVIGSFSIAVTDDAQVNSDSLNQRSMLTDLLLTGELKGYVEAPGYYFPATRSERVFQDLDKLLLTQGWVKYNWDVLNTPAKAPLFKKEGSFMVTGRATNMLNKPAVGLDVLLLSRKPLGVIDTLTNADGRFTFKGLVPVDTVSYFIQARNKKGKPAAVGLEVDEFVAPAFKSTGPVQLPWNVNIDTTLLSKLNLTNTYKLDSDRKRGINEIEEVVIVGKIIVKDSKNLNGPGESSVAISEEEMKKMGRLSLRDVLAERLPEFQRGGGKSFSNYTLRFAHASLIMDGMDVNFSKPEGVTEYDHYNTFLDYYSAEDIRGIEVMYPGGNSMRYKDEYIDPLAKLQDFAFIEITTYSGKGPYMKKTPGTYLFKPLSFNSEKEFYSPKYRVGEPPIYPDIRSTIFWEPNLITDEKGKGQVSFYTGERPGTYTVIIEGTDMNGGVVSYRRKITVK